MMHAKQPDPNDEPLPPGKPENPPVKEPPRPGHTPGEVPSNPPPIDDPRPPKPKRIMTH